MLRYSFDMEEEAKSVEAAVEKVLEEGYRTGDIYKDGCKKCSTKEMGDLVTAKL